ncbi:HAD family hydrolase [Halomarina halobia]|uniref:HAD family hydrolase n=1 Tax=Halomarina halobia TaxID=3033386 RepID=A0ABD6A658_9EURY|nr:HAD family hydrolase [Halomarina sp. PSR21]
MKAIFFDLDGTLLHLDRDDGDVLRSAVAAIDGDLLEEAIDAYGGAFFARFDACEPDPIRGAFAEIGGRSDPDEFADALLAREVELSRPPADAEATLARLSAEYGLGVLTGVREWQEHMLRAHGLFGYFDAFVASYEAGAHKPDAAPFRLAEERLPADEYAMVGDDDADVTGARNAGWTAHRYDGGGFGDLPGALGWE